jgi:hypothetical protein
MTDERFRKLPDPIMLEDTISVFDPGPVPDPDGGKDPELLFVLRYAG